MKQTILGAGGPIAIELAKGLKAYTSDIRLVSRHPQPVHPTDELFPADLTRQATVSEAIRGSQITYVTIGFPYRTKVWRQSWVPFMQQVVDSCLEHGSKLVFFDNVYAIGKAHIHHITEDSPISPSSKKGEVRAEVDRLVLDAIEKRGLQAIIARAPDFFGGTSRANSVMMNLVYDNLVKGKKAQWFCNARVVHSMGYVPDLSRGTAMLGNEPQAYGQVWNLPTNTQRISGEDWISLFAACMGTPDGYTVLPDWLVRVLGLFVPVMGELAEMNYQYDREYWFDSSKFNAFFRYAPTPHAVAVKETVERMRNTDRHA